MTTKEQNRGSSKGFNGLRVAAFESRRAVEMAELISRNGGDPLVAPSMREIPLEENTEALKFGEALFAGCIDLLILLTGIGTRTLVEVLATKYPQEKILEKLSGITTVARGPKPVSVLKGYSIKPTISIPEPNTWREILKTLEGSLSLNGKRVAVQEYGITNKELIAGLEEKGARVMRVPVYRWALPEDTAPLKNALEEVARGEVDVVIFTNGNQITNVMQIAREHGLEDAFRKAMSRSAVVSIGPTTTEFLDEYGFPVDIEPEHSKMAPLVREASLRSAEVLERKRSSGPRVELPPHKKKAQTGLLKNSLFLKACRREPVERTPVWFMRQAGRYLKSYRDLREKLPFIELCKNADLAAEITIDAVKILGVDAAIIFSDILLILEPMGLDLEYAQGDGPVIHQPVRSPADVDHLLEVNVHQSLSFVLEAIRKTRKGLPGDIPLLGFSAAPFTLASYMIEGQTSRNFIHTKSFMYKHPEAWAAMMGKMVDALVPYLNAQIEAGAQAVQIFDSWVGCLNRQDYEKFVLPYTHAAILKLKKGVPVIHFGTQTSDLLELMKQAGGDVIGLDWRVELDEAWRRLGSIAVQGNLDPAVLFADVKTIRREAERILRQAGGRAGHIFNLGHGILPQTPVDHVLQLVDIVKSWRP